MNCKTCIHWTAPAVDDFDPIANPFDPDMYAPMAMPFEVRRCRHPGLLFHERPLESNGFAVRDGSEYFAALYTAEDFGCVRHQTQDVVESQQGGATSC